MKPARQVIAVGIVIIGVSAAMVVLTLGGGGGDLIATVGG